ncbi:MAG: hypothetical protein NT018_09785 [Armatimonadetes bacterium]|nr:hypothetical protein [Armatimonadota bacterium]
MRHLCLVLAAGFLLAAAAPVLAAPQAICVRWQAIEGRAHATYSGAQITLKGVARGGATEFRWDFGDGTSTAWVPIAASYNLGVKHAYTGDVGTEFTATLHVKDAVQEATDIYPIKIYLSADLSVPAELDVRRDVAIDEALWYLHTCLLRGNYGSGAPGYSQPYGNWVDTMFGSNMAATGTCVDAFQVNGHKLIGDYDGDPYVETVRRATNYLLVNTYTYSISPQQAGNPDTNGNGIGLGYLYDSSQVYVGGICTTALASSGSPNYTAPVGGNYVYGRPIKDIVQDMVDFFAWGQNDPGSGMYRGGWRYYANLGSSDMSATQWPPQAMKIARDEMGTTIPAFVSTELVFFLDAMQSNHMDNDNGNFGYTGVDQYVNIKKTAAGIICHEFLGTPWTDPRVQKALGFIYRHWNDNGPGWDYTELHGNSYELYVVMKAFRSPDPDVMLVPEYNYVGGYQTGNSFNWYYTPAGQANQGLATYIVGTQLADGSWNDTAGYDAVREAFCTGWRILALSSTIDTTPPNQPTIDSVTPQYTNITDVSVAFSGSECDDFNRYEGQVDSGGYTTWTSPHTIIVSGLTQGQHTIDVRGVDNSDNASSPASSTFTVDIIAPVIVSVTFSPALIAGGDPVSIVVDATDNIGVTSVTADITPLTNSSGNLWTGTLTAAATLGAHPVTVEVSDEAGNSTSSISPYTTIRSFGLNNRAVTNAIMIAASSSYVFTIWGKVTSLESDGFVLDDGSGKQVKVIAADHGLVVNDYASARGTLDVSSSPPNPPVLTSHVVKKHN